MKTMLSRWNPLKEMEDLQNRLMFPRTASSWMMPALDDAEWSPSVDVTEDEKEFTVTADLPDVPKDQVHVYLDDGMLTIQGERHREKEEKKKKFHRIERSYGSYYRSFQLPESVQADKVDATYEHGVLTVHLPKTADRPAPPRKEVAVH